MAFTLLGIAEQQGKVNDIERHGLEKRFSAAKEPLETFREKLFRREFDRDVMLKDSREAAARPERALEIIKAKYKNSFSSTDNLAKLEELEKTDPKAATEAAKKEIATNLAATQQRVDETSEQVKVAGKDYEKVLAEFQQCWR